MNIYCVSQWDELIEWHKPLLLDLFFNCDDSVAHSDVSLRVIVPVNANKCIAASLFGVKYEVFLPNQGHCQEANIKRNIIIQMFTKKHTRQACTHNVLLSIFLQRCSSLCVNSRPVGMQGRKLRWYVYIYSILMWMCAFVGLCVCCLPGGTYMMWSYLISARKGGTDRSDRGAQRNLKRLNPYSNQLSSESFTESQQWLPSF